MNGDDALEALFVIQDVCVLDLETCVVFSVPFEVIENFTNGRATAEGEKLELHQATGDGILIGRQTPDIRSILGVEFVEDGLGLFGLEFTDDVCLLVARKGFDDAGRDVRV
jgi:hypothetical protein